MKKTSTKMVEVVLACCCLGIKYSLVNVFVHSHNIFNNLDLNVLILCITYFGYVYLLSIFAVSAISGQVPKGVYVKFFNILGAVLYVLSEMILFPQFLTLPLMFGVVLGIMLIVILILDCFDILF